MKEVHAMTELLKRLPIRSPYFYIEVPRRDFYVGLGWSFEGQHRPVVRGGISQLVERTEAFREFKLRISLIISIVFVCAVPPQHKPAGDACADDWPNIHNVRPIFVTYFFDSKPREIPVWSKLVRRGVIRIT